MNTITEIEYFLKHAKNSLFMDGTWLSLLLRRICWPPLPKTDTWARQLTRSFTRSSSTLWSIMCTSQIIMSRQTCQYHVTEIILFKRLTCRLSCQLHVTEMNHITWKVNVPVILPITCYRDEILLLSCLLHAEMTSYFETDLSDKGDN